MKRQAVVFTTIGGLFLIALVSCGLDTIINSEGLDTIINSEGLDKTINSEDSTEMKLYENTLMLQKSKFAYVCQLQKGNTSSSQIFICNFDGTDVHQLTNSPRGNFHPSWSPYGTKIVFTSRRDGNYEIYVMNADGSDQTRLTFDPADDLNPCWSPDGTRIAFQSQRNLASVGKSQIFTMRPDGTDLRLITQEQGIQPSWSPDGTRIVYVRSGIGIWIINADGTNKYKLTDGYDVNPAWSSDGTKIAFVSMRGGNMDSPSVWWVMNADGSMQRQITTDDSLPKPGQPAIGVPPCWSPDGQKLIYFSYNVKEYNEVTGIDITVKGIYAMDPDGTEILRLAPRIYTSGRYDLHFDIAWWAPKPN